MSFTEAEMEEIRRKSTEDMTPEEIASLTVQEKAIRGLIYDPSIYDANWFRGQEWQHPWCQKLFGWLAGEIGPFDSSLDLGAGDGYYSKVLAEMGAEPAIAIEISEEAIEIMPEDVEGMVHDLRNPLDLEKTFDLIVCLEVAEHLPETASAVLCNTIALHCSKWLIFTAATPGQGGHGHCNLQLFNYWKDELESRGVMFKAAETAKAITAWKKILGESLPWLSKNVTLFKRD